MMKSQIVFDRKAEDIGNSVLLEHVNLRVPDQRTATIFYVMGLGLTREPYLVAGVDNMWINVGRNQFHLGPHGSPQVLRGHTGLVLPDREGLLRRLHEIRSRLTDTRFTFAEQKDFIDVTCPWGNRMRCHTPEATRFGPILIGLPYVSFDVPVGTLSGIVRFYKSALRIEGRIEVDGQGPHARVPIGPDQWLEFRETEQPQPDYDGHHIQFYLHDFSRPHEWLESRGLIVEESNRWQYRFNDIVDPDNGTLIFTVEHEVRSMTHPLFGRSLVNRNPDQTNRAYLPGHDLAQWRMPLQR
jgi:hypothetical protein